MITGYKRAVWIKPIHDPETAAIRLETELRELFPEEGSVRERKGGGKGRWWISDRSGKTASSSSVASAFQEIRKRNLKPHMLSGSKHGSSGASGTGSFTVNIDYRIETGDIRLLVQGNDKIIVDEFSARCEQMRAALEQPHMTKARANPLSLRLKLRRLAWTAGISVSVVAAAPVIWPGFLL